MLRIEIRPEARNLLFNFSPHLLQQLGRALAEVAEVTEPDQGAGHTHRMDVVGCTLWCEVQRDALVLVGVDSTDGAAAFA